MTVDEFLFDHEQLACTVAALADGRDPKQLLMEFVVDSLRCCVLDGIVTVEEVADLICRQSEKLHTS